VFHSAVSYVVCDSSAVLARTLDARRLNYSLSLRKSLQLPIPTRLIYSFRSSSAFYWGDHISRVRRSTVLAWLDQSILGFLLLLDRRDSGVWGLCAVYPISHDWAYTYTHLVLLDGGSFILMKFCSGL
jgi:hypothetical protein